MKIVNAMPLITAYSIIKVDQADFLKKRALQFSKSGNISIYML